MRRAWFPSPSFRVLLLAAALIALLAVPAVHDAPTARAHHERDAWSATLTLQDLTEARLSGIGCSTLGNPSLSYACANTSVLTEDEFSLQGDDYVFEAIQLRPTSLSFILLRHLTDEQAENLRRLTLHVGSARHSLAGATIANDKIVTVQVAAHTKTAGDTLELKLTHTPAHPTDGTWSATLTVRDMTSDSRGLGCDIYSEIASASCSNTSTLTHDTITIGPNTYTIGIIEIDTSGLTFGFDSEGARSTLWDYFLHVDDTRLSFKDSVSAGGSANNARWAAHGQTWAAGDTVELRLTRPDYPGDLDPDFGIGGKVTTAFNTQGGEINAVAVQPDGKVVVAGHTNNGTNTDFALARYNIDGSLDNTFGSGGKATIDFGNGDVGNAVAIQPDGKIVVAGYIYDGTDNDFAVARYNANGSLDRTFNSNGKLTTDFGSSSNDKAYAVAIDGNGKIVVAGESADQFAVARYTSAGALDTTFSSDGKVTTNISTGANDNADGVRAVHLLSDNRILVAGFATWADSTFALARYTAAGALDTSFGTNGWTATDMASGAADAADAMAVRSDGKIVLAGYANDGSKDVIAVARYTAAGALDTSFSSDGKILNPTGLQLGNERAHAVAVQSDGKILVAGTDNIDFVVLRFTDAGVWDQSFSWTGQADIDFANQKDVARAMAVLSDDRIVVAGYANNGSVNEFALARLTSGGRNDSAFGIDGRVTTSFGGNEDVANAVAVQSDGKIVVAGYANNGSVDQFAVSRYNNDGSLDTTFSSDGRVVNPFSTPAKERLHAVAVQSDGKIVVAGYFVSNTQGDQASVVRLNANGSRDTSFGTNGAAYLAFSLTDDDQAHALVIQPDGKIVAAGHVNNGTDDDFAVARLNANGSFDGSFSSDGKVITDFGAGDDRAYAIALQSDGKIVVAGYSSDGTDRHFALARYNADGSLDTGFGAGGKVVTDVGSSGDTYNIQEARGVEVDGQGRIVAAGFAQRTGEFKTALARYTGSGLLDGSFGTNGRVIAVRSNLNDFRPHALALQEDGKILVAGYFGTLSVGHFGLGRFTSAGALDESFGTFGYVQTLFYLRTAGSPAHAMALQDDGKIVLAGAAHPRSEASAKDFAVARYRGQGTFSGDATLSALAVSTSTDGSTFDGAATLSPAFDAGATAYTVELAEGVTHVKVTPTTGHADATVTVELTGGTPETVASGSASSAIAVTAGATVEVKVTAEDGLSILTYTLSFAAAGAAGESVGPSQVRYGSAIWSARLTLGEYRGRLGCFSPSIGIHRCDSSATLTEDSFTLGGPVVTIRYLDHNVGVDGGRLALGFSGEGPPASLRHGATLVFDGRAFPLADATPSGDGKALSWTGTGLTATDIAIGQVIEVSLHKSIPPPDAEDWKPFLDLRYLPEDDTRGCRNGLTPGSVPGHFFKHYAHEGAECSDSEVMALDSFSYYLTGETYLVRDLSIRPRGEFSGERLYELVVTIESLNKLPRGFELTLTYVTNHQDTRGRHYTQTHVARFTRLSADIEGGTGAFTYRWDLPWRDQLARAPRVQLGIDYDRTGIAVHVHYDGYSGAIGDVWSATFTVPLDQVTLLPGCATAAACSSALTDDDFTYDGVTYTFNALRVEAGTLSIQLNKAIPASLKSALTLNVDGTAFPLADTTSTLPQFATWRNTGLSWSVGDTVQLSLTAGEQVLGVDGFRRWTYARLKPMNALHMPDPPPGLEHSKGFLAVLPAEFVSGGAEDHRTVLTTHAKLVVWTSHPDSTMEVGRGTVHAAPAETDYTPLGYGQFTEAIELDAVTGYTWMYVRVTNGDQMKIWRVVIDPPPRTFTLAPEIEVAEGGEAELTLTLGSPATSGGVTFHVTAAYGAGGATPADVGQVPATVTVPEGQRTAVITIPTVDDAEVEDLLEHEERFTLTVTHTGYPSWETDPQGTATAVVTIVDNDEPPEGPEPWNIEVVPGDGTLTVTWRIGSRDGWEDHEIMHALRWSQVSGVWANPRDPRAVGRNDGVHVEPGVTRYVITGLENGLPTGVFVRSFPMNRSNPEQYSISERNEDSSEWVRTKGDHTTPQAGEPGANRAPIVLAAIADVTIATTSGTEDVSLSGAFHDADGDALAITAASSDTAVATASVSADHSTLTVTAKSRGTATVTVTADDGNGGTVEDAFTVTVKTAPVVAQAIADRSGMEAGATWRVSLAGVFSDADGDALSVTAASSDTAVAAASATAEGDALTLGAERKGTATITVTARDTDGNEVSAAFQVSVVPAPPVVAQAIADVSGLAVGDTRDVSLSGVFSDADSDVLTITAASSDTDKVTVSVASDGSGLTLTGVAEGTAAVTVTAQDADGNTVSDEFDVSVVAAQQQQAPSANSFTIRLDTAFGNLVGWVEARGEGALVSGDAAFGDRAVNGLIRMDAGRVRLSMESGTDPSEFPARIEISDGAGYTATFDSPSGFTARGLGMQADYTGDASGLTAGRQVTVALGEPAPAPANNSPTVASAIADVSGLTVGDTRDVSLSGVFSDADGDALTITAASSDTGKVTVAVASDGSKLTLTGVAEGTATVTVTARDADGNTVSDAFAVTVTAAQQQQQAANNAPTVASAIADVTIVNAGGTHQVSLSGVFSDADGDALTITAASSDTAKATASVSADQSTLTVTAKSRGTATITVTAADGNGGTVEDAFTVTVKAAPTVASAIADVSGLTVGDTRDVSLAGVFSDADGDSLTITAASSDTGRVNVSVASDGSKLTLTGVAEGAATVTVTAQDADGNRAGDAFEVSVAQAQPPQQPPQQPQPDGPEPWDIRIVPGDGTLTVTWKVSSRDGVNDSDIRHALRWSQEPGVWANPRDPGAGGPEDGVAVEGGVYRYTITGLKNGVATGVFIRSFTGDSYSERSPGSSEWVRIKGDDTTPRAD